MDNQISIREMLPDEEREVRLLYKRSLGSSFPVDPEQASLAYAQSLSIVSYLVETYGWAKVRELLTTFKEGSTYDKALQKVYGFGTDGLEELWRSYITKK